MTNDARRLGNGPSCPDNPESPKKRGPGRPKGFASLQAERIGRSKRSINRAVARGELLANLPCEIINTSLNKGVQLDALIRLRRVDPSAVDELCKRAAAGEKVSAVAYERERITGEPPSLSVEKVVRDYKKLSPAARAQFLSLVFLGDETARRLARDLKAEEIRAAGE